MARTQGTAHREAAFQTFPAEVSLDVLRRGSKGVLHEIGILQLLSWNSHRRLKVRYWLFNVPLDTEHEKKRMIRSYNAQALLPASRFVCHCEQ
jgi:hypothetical protein